MIATEFSFRVPGTTWVSTDRDDDKESIFEYGTPVSSIFLQIGFSNDPHIRDECDGNGFYVQLQYYNLPTKLAPFTCTASIVATLDLKQVRLLRSYCEFLLANHERFGPAEAAE